MKVFLSVLIVQTFLVNPAFAGTALQEADRCERVLGAIFVGDTERAIQIEEEEYPGETKSDKLVKANKLEKTIALVRQIGGGLPIQSGHLPDVRVKESGDIIKRQSWLFPNAGKAFVGCAMYTLTSGEAYVTLKFEDNLDVLTSELTQAAASRTRSPAQRP